MPDTTYDLVVIGGGPGGYVCAIRAAQLGLKAVVVEKADLGGVCLNWGCIPTKALLRNAEVVNLLKHDAKEYGFSFDNLRIDWGAAVKRSRRVVKRLVTGVGALLRKNKVDVIAGEGRLAAPDLVRVQGDTDSELRTHHVVIATGSQARSIPGVTIDGERVIASRHAVVLDRVPETLVIMGAGPIGVEFATIYNAYGSSVVLLEMLPQVLPLEDPEVAAVLEKELRKAGIEVRTGTLVEGVELTDDGVAVHVKAGDESAVVHGDQVLVAIGRTPNSENLGLEELGVATERGFIVVDEFMRTNVPGVYAVGDVAGPPLLAHKAMHEGVVAAEHIAGLDTQPVDRENIPACTYCHPEVASVGLTEAQAREKGHQVKVGKFPFQASGRALGGGYYRGFVKIVMDERYGEILGAQVVGPGATEIIHEIALARAAELTPEDVGATIHAHPTLSEAIAEAALAALGAAIHVPPSK
jgi:dihydrolipoamide dehydrogenase